MTSLLGEVTENGAARRIGMREFMAVAKALGDINRVRALLFLRGGKLCLCQVIEMLGLARKAGGFIIGWPARARHRASARPSAGFGSPSRRTCRL
jgi:hypothetical protein